MVLLRFSLFSLAVALASLAPSTNNVVEAGSLRQGAGSGRPQWDPSFLPPGLKGRYDSLPQEVQATIAGTFAAINLNVKVDGEYVDFDDSGNVLFVDPPPPVDEFPIPDGPNQEYPSGVPLQSSGVPIYHSRPGAPYTLYLDFDGHTFSGTAWAGGAFIVARPYSTDSDYDNYSAQELSNIGNSWAIVAEDFAPFNIDVTTEEPSVLDNTVGHVLMTENVSENGVTIYDCSCGGVAYVSVFGTNSNGGDRYASRYSPALVFNKSLRGVAEAASHEFGHNLGLSHDGKNADAYYTGHGSGETDWAPIMGVGYYALQVQWSKGEYSGATQTQDDLAIISTRIGYAPDDHIEDEPLVLDVDSTWYGEGIIERNSDVDTFTFSGGGTSVTITVTTRPNRYGNLDAGFTVTDAASGTTVVDAVEPLDETSATWTGSLVSGNYKINVYGTGNRNADTGYTDYGSLGQYEVAVTNLIDGTLGPTPNPSPPPTPTPTTPSPTPAPTTPPPTPAPTTPPPTPTPPTPSPTTCLEVGSSCTFDVDCCGFKCRGGPGKESCK